MKRRICSYDLAAVPEDGYVVTDDGGEIYLPMRSVNFAVKSFAPTSAE